MAANPAPRVTPEEYLLLDRAAESRSEYFDGAIYAMSGGSYEHMQISLNFSRDLMNALDGSPCQVLNNDIHIRVADDMYFTYPDVGVVCGEPQFPDGRRDILLNPILIVEVLSKSTEAYDRGFKFQYYRGMPSLREYVLVSQYEPRVEVFRRQPNDEWLLTDYTSLDAQCRLDSVNCAIPLAGIYRNVTFPASPRP